MSEASGQVVVLSISFVMGCYILGSFIQAAYYLKYGRKK